MSENVKEYLDLALKADPHVSPLDAVMDDEWAYIKLGNPMRLSLLGLMLRNQQKFGADRKGGASPALRLPLQVLRRGNQAMVKVIRNGGTSTARGMRDQMNYLAKEGDAALERSDRYFGTELDGEDQETLVESWGISGEAKTNSDKTTHFVVSFPVETDRNAAYRASRAWADEMFANGKYGDVYDYYTAFHTDRAHPHMHVVVNRRGLENGDWLKVSRRSLFNYDEFRAVQVEVAAREGIILEATPRYARGVSDRPIPDAEIRRAEREGRVAVAPEHTPLTAIRAAAAITFYARQMDTDARLISHEYPDLADAMRGVAQAIMEGGEITAETTTNPIIDIDEFGQTNELIMNKRTEILAGIEQIDEELKDVPAGRERSKLERGASKLKASAAALLPDVEELRGFATTNSKGFYRGVFADDEVSREIKQQADTQVHKYAEGNGFDAAKLVGRYQEREEASSSLADQWRQDELEDIRRNLSFRSDVPHSEADALTEKAYDDVHRNALQTYRQAERQIAAHHRKRELQRVASERTVQRTRDDDGYGY